MTRTAPIAIGIAGGRPGAGRRTIAINLAAAVAATGRRVGLTGTDPRGPIIPEMLGAAEPRWRDGRLVPVERYGIQVTALAYLVSEEERSDGRRPSGADLADRFAHLVAWDNLDILFVELPSLKEAAALLIQRLELEGTVIVATPQGAQEGVTEAAVADFGQLGVPILGLIENLSYYQCRHCGQRNAAEASGAVPALARRLGVRYLGEVPISIALRDCTDENRPAVACVPKPPEAALFEHMAVTLLAALDERAGK
ncbi:MAG TPA: P-loop NTPase [Armatimonadota bacterium]